VFPPDSQKGGRSRQRSHKTQIHLSILINLHEDQNRFIAEGKCENVKFKLCTSFPNKNAERTSKKNMINRLLISSAQNTNVRTLPTRFLEIISSKNSSINDQPNESPNFQRCFNAPNELGEWAFLFVLVASICLFSYTHQIPQHCIIMM